MKHYLWTGVVLLCMGANASENPFALDKNFKKLEQEQEVLLSKLKKIADAKELEEESKPIVEEVSTVPTNPVETASEMKVKTEDALAKQEAEKKLDMMRQNALEASQREAHKREALLAEVKAEEEKKRIEIEKKAAEAYQKSRAERIAKEASEKVISEKKSIENKKIEIVTKSESESTSVDDINLTQERLEETRKADEVFAKAVQEMGEEAK